MRVSVKGLLAAWLASHTARGIDPGTNETVEPANVLWFTTEDDPETSIQPRLLAAGLTKSDPGQVFFPAAEWDPRFPLSPGDEYDLQLYVHSSQVGLIILEPGRSFLQGPPGAELNFNNENHVRPGLEQLSDLAIAAGVTILFVHHWHKTTKPTLVTALRDREPSSKSSATVSTRRPATVPERSP